MEAFLIIAFIAAIAVLAWLFWPRKSCLDAEADRLDIGREEYDRLIAAASYRAEHKRARRSTGYAKREDRDVGVDWTPIVMATATVPNEPAPSSSYTPPSVDFTPGGSTGYDGGGSSGSWGDSGSSYSSDSGSSSSGGCD